MKPIFLCSILAIVTFAEANNKPGAQTITISPELMPQVIAFLQKQGRLPSQQELDTQQAPSNPEQAKFCNIVGACATGFVTTIITGNPAPVFSAIVNSIFPLISRSRREPTMPLTIAVIAPAESQVQT